MTTLPHKKLLIIGTLFLILFVLPAAVFVSQQRQDDRSQAGKSTTLSLTPNSTATSPIQKKVGDTITFDVMVNPGTNLPASVKLHLKYDHEKLKPADAPFTVNTEAFPKIVEGPIVTDGNILISLSIGSDPTKAIQKATKVGTLTLIAKSPTITTPIVTASPASNTGYPTLTNLAPNPATPGSTITITGSGGYLKDATGAVDESNRSFKLYFKNQQSGTISCDANQCGGTLALSSTLSAGNYIVAVEGGSQLPLQVLPAPTATPTVIPTEIISPTMIPTAVPTETITPEPTSILGVNDSQSTVISFGEKTQVLSVSQSDEAAENVLSTTTPAYLTIKNNVVTSLSMTVLLHGIGNAGDNANPTAHSESNKNPLHPTQKATVSIYDAQNKLNQLIADVSGDIKYNGTIGSYTGVLSTDLLDTSGLYTVKVRVGKHLTRLVRGVQSITAGQTKQIPPVTLVAGDIDENNQIDIRDYNLLIDCYSEISLPTSSRCPSSKKLSTDMNDDGKVNQFDYNLFLREISVQRGDETSIPPTPTPTPTVAPTATPTPAEGFERPLITVALDDARLSQFTAAWPIMQKYNMKGTFYIPSGNLGGQQWGNEVTMSADNVVALHTAGNQIASHTVTHTDLTTLTSAQVEVELAQAKNDLQTLIGSPIKDFALPFGSFSNSITAQIKNHYRSSRTFLPDGINTKSNTDLYYIQNVGIRNTTQLSQIQQWIDKAKQEKSWLIITYHSIVSNPGEYDTTPQDFDTHLEAIKNSGVPVVTVDKAIEELTPQL